MPIRVALNHKTNYRFSREAWLSPHIVRLRPAPHARTPVLSYSLRVNPENHFVNWQQDPYSNRLARLVFPKKTRALSIEVDLIAELTVINPFDFFLEKYAEEFPFKYDATLARELRAYLEVQPAGPRLIGYLSKVRKQGVRTVDFLVDLNQALSRQIKYVIRMEPGIQTPEQTLTLLSGSCRDSAWLLVQILRHLGLAARFVSGYLIQLVPDVKSLDGPVGAKEDFTDLHAWAEVYIPGAGWIGFDATSGLLAGEGHIPLACTADPSTAAAITGFFSYEDKQIAEADPEDGKSHGDGRDDGFDFSLSIRRIHEDPRVSRPYTDEQWTEIEAMGHRVDAELNRSDVRLTMGGEPTFVSIDDMDGPEWNSIAQSPRKYELGDDLLRRLYKRFAPGGFLHHGQGKWYPGESLPRWALGIYWRKDGQPIWKNAALFADEKRPDQLTENDAKRFAAELAVRLDVDPRFIVPGYEDVWYHLWKERRLPTNVDPLDNKLANKEDRQRLAKIFEQGLDRVIGFALPLRRERYTDDTSAWVSGAWFFRSERMYLIPGDSPMGYRLPLDSLPWAPASDHPFTVELDPWAERGPLPAHHAIARQQYLLGNPESHNPQGFLEQVLDDGKAMARPTSQRHRVRNSETDLPPAQGEAAPWIIRTALCAGARRCAAHLHAAAAVS